MKILIPFIIASSALADSTIQWDASPGAVKYFLYEIKGNTPLLIAETTGLDGTTIPALIGTHVYKLSAVNSAGEGPMTSSFSVTVTAVPGAKAVPLAPANIKVK